MKKKDKINLKNNFNKICGWVLIALGIILLYYSLTTFGEIIELEMSFFFPIVNTLTSIALGILGFYVILKEKWSIILAGVYGLISLLISWWFLGLFNSFREALFTLAYILLIINWWVSNKK